MTPSPEYIADDVGLELEDDLRARVKAELYPGERLLWTSRASRGDHSRSASPTTPMTIAGVCWLLAIAGFVVASKDVQPVAAWLGIGGVLSFVVAIVSTCGSIGVWYGRFDKSRKLAETFYALTDRRAIIWSPNRAKGGMQVFTIPRGKISNVHRVEYRDGTGDVIFAFHEFGFGGAYLEGFEGVSDVRRVEEQVRRTLIDGGSTLRDDGVVSRSVGGSEVRHPIEE